MSARELQHTAIRMLHDPTFLARVFDDPDGALAGLELDLAERQTLLDSDRRAWQVDPHRRWRVLTALLQELSVSAALIGTPHRFEAFFASPTFHEAIRRRESLFVALPTWLRETYGKHPVVAAMLTLESAFIAVRRAARHASTASTGLLQTAPRVRVLALPAGTLAAWEQAAGALRADPEGPIAALVRGTRIAIGQLGPGFEYVLVETTADAPEPVAGFVPDALSALLVFAETPRTREALREQVAQAGMTPAEADEVLDDLLGEGLLVSA